MGKVWESIFNCCREPQEQENAQQDAVVEEGAIALQPLPVAADSSPTLC